MTLSRFFQGLLVTGVLLVPFQVADARPTPQKVDEGQAVMQVKAKLDKYAQAHVSKCNKTIVPGRTSMNVKKQGKEYVAEFREVDPKTVTTEIYESKTRGTQYVGHIVYLEKTYRSVGPTKAKAKEGPFKAVKARRVRELARYDKGAWQY